MTKLLMIFLKSLQMGMDMMFLTVVMGCFLLPDITHDSNEHS